MAEDSEVITPSPVSSDKKRKVDEVDQEPAESEIASQENGEKAENPDENPVLEEENAAREEEKEVDDAPSDEPEAKRPRLDEPDKDVAAEAEDDVPKPEDTPGEDDILKSRDIPADESNGPAENGEPPMEEEVPHENEPTAEIPQATAPLEIDPQSKPEAVTSRKIEVPNNKVGVLIGKAGDTIRYLQYNSGAKIQITRDADADPSSTTRPVELVGTPENINKAEKLIKDVMSEADAGGSPALIARGFATAQTGGEQLLIPIPNDKVGLIIGKGGDTIKSLQTRSGARIQLVPEHSEVEGSKERTIRVTGNKQQIETAREMIKAAMNQAPGKHSAPLGFNHPTYRSSGPPAATQWGARPPPPSQMDYDHRQQGPYPSQNQYPQNYGGYPQQHPPRSSFNVGWDQRLPGPKQAPPQGGYYGQGGHTAELPSAASAPQANYNYGQLQGGPGYGQPPQQGYGQYGDSSYGKPNQTQPFYGGQQQGNSQPGYPQQIGFQSGYMQDGSNKATYENMSSQGPASQSYGPPRAAQPGEVQPGSAPHGYGTSQQPYPYASGAPPQQSYPYGSAAAANDGYNNQSIGSAIAPGYSNAGGYSQYPSQRGYGDHQAPNNSSYGYQGPTDTGYSNVQGPTAYGGQTNNQQAYGPPTANTVPYDQQAAPQSGYGSYGGNAPAGYGKTVSPQPAYGQYDSAQMYGHH